MLVLDPFSPKQQNVSSKDLWLSLSLQPLLVCFYSIPASSLLLLCVFTPAHNRVRSTTSLGSFSSASCRLASHGSGVCSGALQIQTRQDLPLICFRPPPPASYSEDTHDHDVLMYPWVLQVKRNITDIGGFVLNGIVS